MKAWKTAVVVAATTALFVPADADAQTRKRPRARAAAAPAASGQWGVLSRLADSAWLDEKSGTVTQYRWKLRNEILEIETQSKDALEPAIDQIRLGSDGLTIARTTIQPVSLLRQYAVEMPREGMLIESDALGATVTRRTSRVTGNRVFLETEVTINGAPSGNSAAEWRKLAPTEVAGLLGAIAANQSINRQQQAELENKWGPLAKLVDTDWRWKAGDTSFTTQYRWREPGKTIVATHAASRKSSSYEETMTLDPVSGAITGKSDGVATTYSFEDGALVSTPASAKSRTLRKVSSPTSYQLILQKRKGEDWIEGDRILVATAMGGIPTVPIQLVAPVMAPSGPLQVAMPIRTAGSGGNTPEPSTMASGGGADQPAPPKKKSQLLSTLVKVGGVAAAVTGVGLIASALAGAGGGGINTSSLGQSAQTALSSAVTDSVSGGGKSASSVGGSYSARPNILAGKPACRGYTVDNYKSYFQQHSSGPDVQLHSLCAGAYNYYWMYLNAIKQGYSQADSDRTYAAFTDSAKVALNFYATAR